MLNLLIRDPGWAAPGHHGYAHSTWHHLIGPHRWSKHVRRPCTNAAHTLQQAVAPTVFAGDCGVYTACNDRNRQLVGIHQFMAPDYGCDSANEDSTTHGVLSKADCHTACVVNKGRVCTPGLALAGTLAGQAEVDPLCWDSGTHGQILVQQQHPWVHYAQVVQKLRKPVQLTMSHHHNEGKVALMHVWLNLLTA